jgi:hypothetical protein
LLIAGVFFLFYLGDFYFLYHTCFQGSTRPVKMKVRNAIRRMEKGEKMYIANIDTIFRRNNDLVDDLEFADRVKPWAYNPYDPYAVQMFLGFGSEDKAETTGNLEIM